MKCVEYSAVTLQRENIKTKEGLAHHQSTLKLYETALTVFPDDPFLLFDQISAVDSLQERAQQLTMEGLKLLNEQSLPNAENAFLTSLDIWARISHYKEEEFKPTVALINQKLQALHKTLALKQGDVTTELLQNAMQRAEKIPLNSGKFPPISEDAFQVVNEAVKNNWPAMEMISAEIANDETVVTTIANCIKQEKEKGKRTGEVVLKKSAQLTDERFNQLLAEGCNSIHAQHSREANDLKKHIPMEEDTRIEEKKASQIQSVETSLPVAHVVPPSAPPMPFAEAQAVVESQEINPLMQQFPDASLNLPSAPTHGFSTTNLEQEMQQFPDAPLNLPSAPTHGFSTTNLEQEMQQFPDAPLNLPSAPTHGFSTTNLVQATRRAVATESKERN